MVVLESMAAGTPVVGTRDGALPQLISEPGTGLLFDPGAACDAEVTNVTGMAEAMERCLDLAADPATAHRCRNYALRYSWREVGPSYEQLLRSAAAERPSGSLEVASV